MELHFTNLLIVVAVGFCAPLALGFVPRLQVPAVVLEIVAGIVVGPAVLGWVEVDDPVEVLSIVGLAFLLFLAGLEIEFDKLRGRGAILTLVDRDTLLTRPDFRRKLEAAGFGIFIPLFFLTSGVRYDLDALGDVSTLAHVRSSSPSCSSSAVCRLCSTGPSWRRGRRRSRCCCRRRRCRSSSRPRRSGSSWTS